MFLKPHESCLQFLEKKKHVTLLDNVSNFQRINFTSKEVVDIHLPMTLQIWKRIVETFQNIERIYNYACQSPNFFSWFAIHLMVILECVDLPLLNITSIKVVSYSRKYKRCPSPRRAVTVPFWRNKKNPSNLYKEISL